MGTWRSAHLQELGRLLTQIFNQDDLSRFARLHFTEIHRELPPPHVVPVSELVYAFLESCIRHGILEDIAFWQALRDERPRLSAEIRELARSWVRDAVLLHVLDEPDSRPGSQNLARLHWRAARDALMLLVCALSSAVLLLLVSIYLTAANSEEKASIFGSLLTALVVFALASAGLMYNRPGLLGRAYRTTRRRVNRWFHRFRGSPAKDVADPELRDTAVSFFSRAQCDVKVDADDLLRVPDCAVLALQTPPTPQDAHRLGAALKPRERGYFLHRAGLSERVQEILDELRLRGHAVAPLALEVMRAAISDDTCAKIFGEIEQTYFRDQNLFRKKNALWDRRFFFGRKKLLTSVGSALEHGDAILLTGLRKSGKSSFLNILRQHMASHPWCHVDLQRFASTPAGSSWPLIVARELIAAIDRWGRAELRGDWPSHLPAVTSLDRLNHALEARRAVVVGRGYRQRPVLVLDEVERVFPRTDDRGGRGLAEQLVAAGVFRAEAQSGPWLTMIAADLRPVLNRTNVLPNGDTNPYFQFFQEIPLPLFQPEETGEMVSSIGRAMGIRDVDTEFIRALHEYSCGHPGLAREIAAKARDVQENPFVLATGDLTRALTQLHRDDVTGSFFAENIWGPATPAERAALRWIGSREKAVPFREIPIELQQPGLWADLAAQGLIRRVMASETGHSLVGMAMQGLSRWILQQERLSMRSEAIGPALKATSSAPVERFVGDGGDLSRGAEGPAMPDDPSLAV